MASRAAKRKATAEAIDLTSQSPSKPERKMKTKKNTTAAAAAAAATTSPTSPGSIGQPRLLSSPGSKDSAAVVDGDFDFTFDDDDSDDVRVLSPGGCATPKASGKISSTKRPTKNTPNKAGGVAAAVVSAGSKKAAIGHRGSGSKNTSAGATKVTPTAASARASAGSKNTSNSDSGGGKGSKDKPKADGSGSDGDDPVTTVPAAKGNKGGRASAPGAGSGKTSTAARGMAGENGKTNSPQVAKATSPKSNSAVDTTPTRSSVVGAEAAGATTPEQQPSPAVKAAAVRTPQGSSIGVGPASALKRAAMAPMPKAAAPEMKVKDEEKDSSSPSAGAMMVDDIDGDDDGDVVKSDGDGGSHTGAGARKKQSTSSSAISKKMPSDVSASVGGATAVETSEGRRRPSRSVAKKSYVEDSDTDGYGKDSGNDSAADDSTSEKDKGDDEDNGDYNGKRKGKGSKNKTKKVETANGGSKSPAKNGSKGTKNPKSNSAAAAPAPAAATTATRRQQTKKKNVVKVDAGEDQEENESATGTKKGRKNPAGNSTSTATGKGKGKARATPPEESADVELEASDGEDSPPRAKKNGRRSRGSATPSRRSSAPGSSAVAGGGRSADNALALKSDDMGLLDTEELALDAEEGGVTEMMMLDSDEDQGGDDADDADDDAGNSGVFAAKRGQERRRRASGGGGGGSKREKGGQGAGGGENRKNKKKSSPSSSSSSEGEESASDLNDSDDGADAVASPDSDDSYIPTAAEKKNKKSKPAAASSAAVPPASKRRKSSTPGDGDGGASGGNLATSASRSKGKGKAKARAGGGGGGGSGRGVMASAKPTKLADDITVVLKKLRRLRNDMEGTSARGGAVASEADGGVKTPTLQELGLNGDITEVREMGAQGVMDEIERIAVEVAESIVGGKGFSFRVPTRSSGNQKYVEELDRIVLGDKVSYRNFVSTAMARKTAITTRVVQLVHQVLGKGIHITKRDMFYTDVKLFKDQADSDAVLDDVACMVGCTRSCLNVVASDKGLVVGRVSFLEDGDLIDCTRMGVGGKAIPPYIDKISDIKSDADFILLVEKEAAYMRMAEDRFYQKYPCIVITAKGQPDVATRLFLKRLKRELNIPVMGLVDSDPYGLKILSVYMSGSKNMSYDSASLTTPDIKWLGVRPSDLDRYNIPEQCRLDMTDHDIKTGKELMQEDFIKKNAAWYRELELMIKTKKKAEIQSLSAFGFQYLTETYLPQKLQNGDWV